MSAIKFGTRWHLVVKGLLSKIDIPNTPNILDIGGGIGVFKNFIPNSKYYVIDIDEKLLKNAKRNDCITIKQDLNKLPIRFKSNYFDLIFALEVFEHVIYPDSLLKEIKRIMKVNSIGIFSFPNWFHFGSRIKILFNKREGLGLRDYDGREVQFFNLDDAKKFISSKLKIVDIKYSWLDSGYLKNLPTYFRKSLASMFPNLFAESIVIVANKE